MYMIAEMSVHITYMCIGDNTYIYIYIHRHTHDEFRQLVAKSTRP